MTRPGSTPSTTVPTLVIASAAITGCGVTIGVTSPSGTSSIHIVRITRR